MKSNKIKQIVNVLVSLLVLTGVILLVYDIIINIGKKNSSIIINKGELENYEVEEKLVKDYSEFYTIQKIIQVNIENMFNEKYEELYDIMTEEIKLSLTKDYTVELKQYYLKNFKYIIDYDLSILGYMNENNLLRLYKLSDISYLAVVKTLTGETRIGIELISEDKYVITYMEV